MITRDVAFFQGNYQYSRYAEEYVYAFLSGLKISTFSPIDADPERNFGLVSDKRLENERKTFVNLDLNVCDVLREVLIKQYDIPFEIAYDWERSLNFSLDTVREAFPEYKDKLPHVLPVDWATVARFAKEHNEDPNTVPLKERSFAILPKPRVTKDDEFELLMKQVHPTNHLLCVMASLFAGYSVKYESVRTEDPNEPFMNLYGSVVQEPQRTAFFETISKIKEQQKTLLCKAGVAPLAILEWHGVGAEDEFYPAYADVLKMPLPLDWAGIAKKAQEIVTDLSKDKNIEKE